MSLLASVAGIVLDAAAALPCAQPSVDQLFRTALLDRSGLRSHVQNSTCGAQVSSVK